jgi:hypothetical protein
VMWSNDANQHMPKTIDKKLMERWAKDLTRQIYPPRSLFFEVVAKEAKNKDRRPLYGPQKPKVWTEAATFVLENGWVEIQGHGWEAEYGRVTRTEAEEIVELLTWALREGLVVEG